MGRKSALQRYTDNYWEARGAADGLDASRRASEWRDKHPVAHALGNAFAIIFVLGLLALFAAIVIVMTKGSAQ